MQDNEWIYMENLEEENKHLKAQLARLNDVEGLAKLLASFTEDTYSDMPELFLEPAQAVINYIKGE